MNTVSILWMRQMKRYKRSGIRMVLSVVQPLVYLLTLGFGFNALFQQAGKGSYIQFVVPGVVAQTILFTSIFWGINIMWDKQFGFLKETLVAPVSRLKVMLGGSLGGASIVVIQGFMAITNFLVIPLFFLSSALSPLDNVPKVMKVIASANPLTYAVDAMRASLVNQSHFGLPVDFTVMAATMIVLIWFSIYRFNRIQA